MITGLKVKSYFESECNNDATIRRGKRVKGALDDGCVMSSYTHIQDEQIMDQITFSVLIEGYAK